MTRGRSAKLAWLLGLTALALACSEETEPEAPLETLKCNGHAALCERRFDQVAYATTHNSMSNADEGWLAPNQEHGIERQLEDGVRGFLIDTHYDGGGAPALCHSSCSFGERPLVEALSAFTAFLRAHPNEVIALLVEDYVTPEDTQAAFEASGLAAYAYPHPPGSAWPTLGQLIEQDLRVVVMAQDHGGAPAWYHPLWDLAWDTPYSFEKLEDFSCELNRGRAGSALFLLNHWVENPLANPRLSALANDPEVLLARAERCQTESGSLPNFVAVNHYAAGGLLQVVDTLNGVTSD